MANELTEAAVIKAVLCRLRAQLDLKDAQCYLVETVGAVTDVITAGGGYVLQVSGGDLRFEQSDGEQDAAVLPATIDMEVGVLTRMQLDPGGKAENLILDTKRGLSKVASRVTKALVGWDIDDKLASKVSVNHWMKAQYDENKAIAWRVLSFSITFDMDVT